LKNLTYLPSISTKPLLIELASGLTISDSSSFKCNEVNSSFFFVSPSSEHEVLQVIKSLKNSKAYDIYDISTPIIKRIAPNIAKILGHLFNCSISEGVVPAGLKYSKVVPVYKAKD
jgi:hypothetical protein